MPTFNFSKKSIYNTHYNYIHGTNSSASPGFFSPYQSVREIAIDITVAPITNTLFNLFATGLYSLETMHDIFLSIKEVNPERLADAADSLGKAFISLLETATAALTTLLSVLTRSISTIIDYLSEEIPTIAPPLG